jgi:hypothetical protein
VPDQSLLSLRLAHFDKLNASQGIASRRSSFHFVAAARLETSINFRGVPSGLVLSQMISPV